MLIVFMFWTEWSQTVTDYSFLIPSSFLHTAGGLFEVDERSGVVRARGSEPFQLDMEYALYVKAEDQNGRLDDRRYQSTPEERHVNGTLKTTGQGAGTFNIGPTIGNVRLAKNLDFEDLR